ncbi:MAG: WD40/YVTN/BNR-like repeat-containing protein, partial [Chitinophagales bacterium]
MKNTIYLFLLASLYLAFSPTSLSAQITFTTKSTDDGLGSNNVISLFAEGDNVYVGTQDGLSISTDNGDTFSHKTSTEGLAGLVIQDVFADGNKVYAAHGINGVSTSTDGGNTFTSLPSINPFSMPFGIHASGDDVYVATFGSGLFVSEDGGLNFVQKNEFDGMAGNIVWDVFVEGDNVYGAQFPGLGGISISNDGGDTFVYKTLADGLGSITAMDVFAVGNEVYLATEGGLAISMDGGATFVNKTTDDGLAHNRTHGVFAEGDNVYAATDNGLSISNDNGQTFTSYLDGQGLTSIAYANGTLYVGGNMLYISTLEEEVIESSWSVADITTDCMSNEGTYDVCYSASDLDGAIGLDVSFSYPSQLTPVATDFITLKDLALNTVGGDASQIDVFSNSDVAGEV